MEPQFVIVLIFVSLLIGIVFWYFNQKKVLDQVHNQNVLSLEKKISKNTFQINFRETNLNKYDFLKYNLSEVMILQLKIRI